MNRGRYIAVVVLVLALVGLVAVNLGDDADVPADVEGSAAGTDVPSEESAPESESSAEASTEPLPEAPPRLGQAGDLTDLDGWLQTDATAFSDFDGQVRVVQFWTFGCINCKNTLDNLAGLYAEFEPRGLEVIGVHAPEFAHEAEVDAIAEAAVRLNVTWPIALDTDKTNFRAWQPGRRFWPRTFVIDTEGVIRFDHIGEGAYDELNATVAYLIEHGA